MLFFYIYVYLNLLTLNEGEVFYLQKHEKHGTELSIFILLTFPNDVFYEFAR